ncbi:hypothetical protein FRC08_006555 [Ceratobasidium sp. 394]|nr:hypothetical protein FRC08_006555 [Ceratobasidium sp. 394]
MNSFLIPLLDELLLLERGVESIKASPAAARNDVGVQFVLRAFMIMLFGDIPAVTKLLAMKGHNGKLPCRTCYMQGVLYRYPRTSVYYVPLTLPGAARGFPPHLLLLRTHELFLLHYRSLEALVGQRARHAEHSQDLGINARPIFAHLKSIDLGSCAPYDIMHLLFENLVPNMIAHWTGRFKMLDQGTENYQLAPAQWAEIGRLTARAARTIPSQFVGTIPDIAQDQNLFKAEAYAFWWQYIGPIVLQGRLNQPYYDHYLLGREIVIRCVQLEITSAELDELEEMIIQWVSEYERYYYQHDYERLRACPLTIHALLHMPHYIRHTGPLCGSWSFVMERFCGHLLPAVKNRYQPYQHLDNYILRRAQMQVVCHKYGLPPLARSTVKWRYEGGERLSTHERMYEAFPHTILGRPVVKSVPANRQLTDQLTKYFGPVYRRRELRYTAAELRTRIDFGSLTSYGRFRMINDGDRIRTASVVDRANMTDGGARDNSFVRFTVLPDANADDDTASDVPFEEVNYGRLINVYYVEFIEDLENNVRRPFLLARIKSCRETNGLDAALPENPLVTYRTLSTPDIFHINTIDAVIGRVRLADNSWGIIDRSRDGARTQFVDDDGDDDDEVLGGDRRGCERKNIVDSPGPVDLSNDLSEHPRAYDFRKSVGPDADLNSAQVRRTLYGGLYTPTRWPDLAKELKGMSKFLDNPKSSRPPKKRSFMHPRTWDRHSNGQNNNGNSTDDEGNENDDPPSTDYAFQAIACADAADPGNITTKVVFDSIVDSARTASPIFGQLWNEAGLYCHNWPVRAVERFTGPFNKTLSNKIIVIGNEADPSTPFLSAKSVADALGDSAILIEQDDFGVCQVVFGMRLHLIIWFFSTCPWRCIPTGNTQGALTDYFLNNTLPSSDKFCGTNQVLFPGPGITKNTLSTPAASGASDSTELRAELDKAHTYGRNMTVAVIILACIVTLLLVALVLSFIQGRKVTAPTQVAYVSSKALEKVDQEKV